MGDRIDEFNDFRERLNKKILDSNNLSIKRFFNLDNKVYEEGEMSSKTKEMLGLAASMVLRCDDCITYHIIRCYEEGVSRREFEEIFSIVLVVGGSIVIPHLRRAVSLLEELETDSKIKTSKARRDQVNETITNKADNNHSKNSNVYEIYTDGACTGNPGPGGYAAIIIENNGSEKTVTGFKKNTTNNRMELMAVIEGLKEVPQHADVHLHVDSNYVIKGINQWIKEWKTNNWKTASNKGVKNKDLWQELDHIIQNYNVNFIKVKAHTGNKYNEKADNLSREQINKKIN